MLDILLEFLFSFLLLPVFAIIATPWILLRNIFRKGSYFDNVKKSYKKVMDFWAKTAA